MNKTQQQARAQQDADRRVAQLRQVFDLDSAAERRRVHEEQVRAERVAQVQAQIDQVLRTRTTERTERAQVAQAQANEVDDLISRSAMRRILEGSF